MTGLFTKRDMYVNAGQLISPLNQIVRKAYIY
jgi:hypothetical protein